MFYKKHDTGSDFYRYVAVLQVEQIQRRDSAGCVRVKLTLADNSTVETQLRMEEFDRLTSGLMKDGLTINP